MMAKDGVGTTMCPNCETLPRMEPLWKAEAFSDQVDSVANTKSVASPPFKVVSLFSGCGGLDLGFLGNFEIFGQEYPVCLLYTSDAADDLTRVAIHSCRIIK